jgi:protein-S-isoprenylcysteine O-methyltransferase Ste14
MECDQMTMSKELPPAPGVNEVDEDRSDTPDKVFALLFGAAVYLAVWVILIYILFFVGNFFDPILHTKWGDVLPLKSIDMGTVGPVWQSVLIDIGLVVILGLQHSIMPRPWFKATITKVVPPHLERDVYIIFAICALSLLIWQWRPLPEPIWDVKNPIIRTILNIIQICGWLTVLLATIQVGHWKIFGVTQVLDYVRDKPYTRRTRVHLSPQFFAVGWPISASGLWYFARHPDFFGFITAFWVTPTMTYGHLIFAVGLTTYIMVGIYFLENNLTELYGSSYAAYVRVRSKIIPWFVRDK